MKKAPKSRDFGAFFIPARPCALERVLQPELDLAPAIDGDGRVVKVRVRHIVCGREQVRMVERVKQIHTELKHLIVELPEMDREIALDGRVEVDLSRPEERIAAEISRHRVGNDEVECAGRLRGALRSPSKPGKNAVVFIILT